ncbi:MAG: hypothetical protein DRJ64_03470 [Thermoprotei archaeon]|nr:MAG: hypothetical protein DRJ64_03470 [Thermoprotei archaeon]
MISIFHIIVVSDLIGSVILFLISYFSLKALRRTSIKIFLFFSLGFALLAAGRLSHSLVFTTLAVTRPAKILITATSFIASFITLFSEVIAYALIAIGYSRNIKSNTSTLRISSISTIILLKQILIQVIGELINIFLLIYIVFRAGTIYLTSKKRLSFITFLGFVLLLVSHLLKFISLLELSESLFILSKFVYFAGLLFFLTMVIKVAITR